MEIRKQPRIIASAIIRQGDKILLTKEILESGEKWIIPGGGVEFGENLIDAVKREIKEEANSNYLKNRFWMRIIFPPKTLLICRWLIPLAGRSASLIFRNHSRIL